MGILVARSNMAKRVPLRRLTEYLADYQGDFQRRDQVRWAAVYLQGLLANLQRKNIENIAAASELPDTWDVTDAKQALQNFINQSPWDENRLWRRYRARVAQRFGRDDGVFIIQEVSFVKQGRHSVGVQRQFSAALGQKINCQLAVAIHYVSGAGQAPLAIRLYLPLNWTQTPDRLEVGGVPVQFQSPTTKTEIALQLLDELRTEKFPGARVAAAGLEIPETIRMALHERGFEIVESEHLTHRRILRQAQNDMEHMQSRLGLDHFEGRSWRGFHHHACLVALAFAYENAG